MPPVKNVGEPCAGEPHARIDGGREETSDSRPRRATPGASRLPDQSHAWCDRVNQRVHRTTRAVVAERLAAEHAVMRCVPTRMPDTDRRFVMRVPAQPYLRVDRNDYSLDPRLVGRRVEVRVSQTEITAV